MRTASAGVAAGKLAAIRGWSGIRAGGVQSAEALRPTTRHQGAREHRSHTSGLLPTESRCLLSGRGRHLTPGVQECSASDIQPRTSPHLTVRVLYGNQNAEYALTFTSHLQGPVPG